MHSLISAMVGGLLAGVVASITAYVVTYDRIERPKIALEAHRQALLISPHVQADCADILQAKANSTIAIRCKLSNHGSYPAMIQVRSVSIVHASSELLKEGSGLKVSGNIREPNVRIPVNGATEIDIFASWHSDEAERLLDDAQTLQFRMQVTVETQAETRAFLASTFPDIAPLLTSLAGHTLNLNMPLVRQVKKVLPRPLPTQRDSK